MVQRTYTTLPYIEKPVLAYGVQRDPITTIILHSTAGTASSAISWFNNPNAGTSAHYIIANNGQLYAMLEEYLTGYHAGNYDVNLKSLGIEHEGYTGLVRSNAEYTTSAKLVADICKYYSIPCDRAHIKPHWEITQTSCPTDLDVDRIIREAKILISPPEDQATKDLKSVKSKINSSLTDEQFKSYVTSFKATALRQWMRKAGI